MRRRRRLPPRPQRTPAPGLQVPVQAPPQTYTPQGRPLDPAYYNELARNVRDYADAQQSLQRQQSDIQQQFDPSDPFGRAAALEQSFKRHQEASRNSWAARGQLNSGVAQMSLAKPNIALEQDRASMARQQRSAESSLALARQRAERGKSEADLSAEERSLERALKYPTEDPGAPPAPPPPVQQVPRAGRPRRGRRRRYR